MFRYLPIPCRLTIKGRTLTKEGSAGSLQEKGENYDQEFHKMEI